MRNFTRTLIVIWIVLLGAFSAGCGSSPEAKQENVKIESSAEQKQKEPNVKTVNVPSKSTSAVNEAEEQKQVQPAPETEESSVKQEVKVADKSEQSAQPAQVKVTETPKPSPAPARAAVSQKPASKPVTQAPVKKPAPAPVPKQQPVTKKAAPAKTVSIAIVGPKDRGTVLDLSNVSFKEGDTVLNILLSATKKKGIAVEYSGSGAMAYIEGIDNIYEFDYGPKSGWVGKLNGKSLQKSAGTIKVKTGDRIQFIYTEDSEPS